MYQSYVNHDNDNMTNLILKRIIKIYSNKSHVIFLGLLIKNRFIHLTRVGIIKFIVSMILKNLFDFLYIIFCHTYNNSSSKYYQKKKKK